MFVLFAQVDPDRCCSPWALRCWALSQTLFVPVELASSFGKENARQGLLNLDDLLK